MFSQTYSRAFTALAFAGAALGLAACSGDATSSQMGTLKVALTDAPFPFDSVARVDVFVVRIDARKTSTDSAGANADIEGDDSPGAKHGDWTTVATPNASINLLDLQGGKVQNLGQLTLPTGDYNGFRLILDTRQSTVTLKNGTVLTGTSTPGIKFPSAARTGIKINLDKPISLTANGSVMVLDFDLGNSFVMRGNSISQNGLLFKPVIRATATDITGSIAGSVHGDSATGVIVKDATVEVLKPGTALTDTTSANLVSTTKTDSTGAFTVAFVLPGSYTLRATPPSASVYGPALTTSNVTVVTQQTAGPVTIVVPKK